MVYFIQVASTKWFLGVQIQHFENPYNVEIINGDYCCCHDNAICSGNLIDLFAKCTDQCTAQPCETYFLVYIRDCVVNSECFISKTYQLNYTSSASVIDHGILSIPLMEMELSDHVRTNFSYLMKLSAKFRKFAIIINRLISGELLLNCAVLIFMSFFV